MMNKRNVRAFAFGVFFTACVIGSYYSFFEETSKTKKENLTEEQAKELLNDAGYQVMTQKEFEEYVTKEAKPKVSETEPKTKEKDANAEKTASDDKEQGTKTYKLVIETGMFSEQIVELLFKEKIIEDKYEFKSYLEDKGYSTKIQAGTFSVTNDMSYEQLAKTITKD
ncbi:endolytic transglycosylase MltG [Cytobacillus spongiae]|uniref:endolytic transglycosylase MltG n=1 Tax=Cytobacillus spongiae TaxID=2901381 RepID=UPI001F358E3F|nr:endolytic transglycosylase MltG [Cytobacillus spongiae]UII54870.1 endolytic transglycosylase MltG [Cytobacillus spongiae]